jgi:ribosomal protein L10
MSKYVKNLITDYVRSRLEGVNDAVLVNVIGLESNNGMRLRAELRSKNIQLLVVKNSLAARALADTPLARMFDGVAGSAAVVWGSSDIVSLAKEVTRLVQTKEYEKVQARGGVMDGSQLTAAQVSEVSKWPSREEQISILVGQILGPGARLAAQLCGPGGALASQIAEKAKGAEDGVDEGGEATEAGPEGGAPEGSAQEGAAT